MKADKFRPNQRASYKIQFDASPEEFAQVREKADERGIAITEYVRRVLAESEGIVFRERLFTSVKGKRQEVSA